NRTLVDEMNRLNSELNNTRARADKTDAALKRARDDFEQERNADQAALKKANEAKAKAEAAVVEEQNKKSQAYLQALEDIARKDKELEDMKKSLQNTTEDKDKIIRQKTAEIAQMEIRIKKLQDKLPQLNVLDYDVAKGKIVRLDPSGNTAY